MKGYWKMAKVVSVVALVLILAACTDSDVSGTTAANAPAKIVRQTTCPIMGGDIDRSLYVDHAGKRIYVCCSGCLAPIKENPEKYIKELEAKGITLDKAP